MHQEENQQANGNANANDVAQPGTRIIVRRRVFIATISFWVFYLFLGILNSLGS